MRTSVRDAALALAAVLSLAGAGRAAQGVEPAKAAPPAPVRPPQMEFITLPGYAALSRKDVRDDLGLTADQTKKLVQISQNYLEELRQQNPFRDLGKLPAEERTKKLEEITAEHRKRQEGVRKQVEAVLTPEQVQKLELVELRQQVPQLLFYGPGADRLGLSDEQKEKLRKNREELQKTVTDLQRQMQKAHDQAGQAAVDLLTPEQVKKLKEMRKDASLGWGFVPGHPAPGAAPPKK